MGTMTAAPPPDGIEVHQDVPLARHTYLRLGGPARFFAIPEDVAQLELLLGWARGEALSVRVLGGGSNLLVADEGIDALVVSLRRAAGSFRFEGDRVSAGAAVMMPALSRAAAERGLGGLEFAIGIPGAVGGALNSNAGIGDGRAIGNLVESVEVIGGRGRMTIPRDQLHFSYRRSSLRGAGVMVLGATLRLQPRPGEEIEAEQRALLEHRQATQPTAGPNAGSIFTNPEGDYAGRLIEAAGCKGLDRRRGASQRAARQLLRPRRHGERCRHARAAVRGAAPRPRSLGRAPPAGDRVVGRWPPARAVRRAGAGRTG